MGEWPSAPSVAFGATSPWRGRIESCPLSSGFGVDTPYSLAAISASLATVFMLRAVPVFAPGILSFESAMPCSG